MKKKILLSVFSLFSLMIATKSFAQSYHKDVVVKHQTRSDIRDVQHDQANIKDDLARIERTKAKMNTALAHHNYIAYRKYKAKLVDLNKQLAEDRNELAIDMRHVHIDRRTASSSRRF